MSTTLYLRFPTEVAFRAVMPAGFAQEGETGYPLPDGIKALSIIGPMYTGGTFDVLGAVVTPPVQVPGFHVNALGVLPASWAPYQIAVSSPSRVFG